MKLVGRSGVKICFQNQGQSVIIIIIIMVRHPISVFFCKAMFAVQPIRGPLAKWLFRESVGDLCDLEKLSGVAAAKAAQAP